MITTDVIEMSGDISVGLSIDPINGSGGVFREHFICSQVKLDRTGGRTVIVLTPKGKE